MKQLFRLVCTCLAGLLVLIGTTSVVSSAVPGSIPTVSRGGAEATERAQRLQPPAPPPAAPDSGRFATLAPGTPLPSDAACASAVRPAAEIRPINNAANHTRGVLTAGVAPAVAGKAVTGNFVGTTDEIIQWAACKCGIDEDIVRAQIAKESGWHMDAYGDAGSDQSACPPRFRGSATCPQSIGLGQVRFAYHGAAFVNDNAINSSAYNLDYTYSRWRACFEGSETWFNDFERGSQYAAGDAWGCVGAWFAGRWRTAPAVRYISEVQDYLVKRIWATPEFLTW
ncbi:MAG: hypothetical protein ABIR32_19305 [Ilumatobacteraceae bacterium]